MRTIFLGLPPLLPHYVDQQGAAGLTATFDVRLRGDPNARAGFVFEAATSLSIRAGLHERTTAVPDPEHLRTTLRTCVQTAPDPACRRVRPPARPRHAATRPSLRRRRRAARRRRRPKRPRHTRTRVVPRGVTTLTLPAGNKVEVWYPAVAGTTGTITLRRTRLHARRGQGAAHREHPGDVQLSGRSRCAGRRRLVSARVLQPWVLGYPCRLVASHLASGELGDGRGRAGPSEPRPDPCAAVPDRSGPGLGR